ncbi:hypothetical protein IQ275_35385, partial [Nostoc sp. LEGE 12450]|nr:hypothetical protein [Nostoc sp. LEGE 12450]
MNQLPPDNSEPQQPDVNSTQQADSSAPQNVVQGNQNRVVQGKDNKAVQGDSNIVSQGNSNTQNIHITNYYYREDIRVAAVKPAEDAASDEKLPCPYRGLYHFSPDDAEYFFGREVFTEELFKATQTRNFIPVLGASGSGKSSVVLAGLVPKLQQQGRWLFTHFRPGSNPFYGLAEALVPLYAPDLDDTDRIAQTRKLSNYFCNGDVLLIDVITKIQQNHPHHRVLLIADQFEELYTLCNDEKTRRNFLDCLLTIVQSPTSKSLSAVFVATMRVDFLSYALSYPEFAELLKADIKIRSMKRSELTDIIAKPAQKLGVTFQDGLIERILDDVKSEPGNLPLLEFALTLLWEKRINKQLTHAAYEAIGEVQGALATHADTIYKKFNATEQQQVSRIFLQLVRPGEGTEDTRRVATKAEIGEENWLLVQDLADERKRLVVTSRSADGQETVEVAHEALIQHWQLLQSWIDENRSQIIQKNQIERLANEWQNNKKSQDYLLTGSRLAETEKFLSNEVDTILLSNLAREFVQNSQEYQLKQEKRWRKLYEEAEGQRTIALARQLAAQSELLRNQHPHLLERSVLLAIEAVKRYHSVETDQTLRQGLNLLARPLINIKNSKNRAKAISFSPDGNLFTFNQEEDTVQIWQWNENIILKSLNHRKKLPPPNFHNYKFSIYSSFFISQDFLVTISVESFIKDGYLHEYGTIWLWEVLTGTLINSETLPAYIINIDFCASRNFIVAVLPLSYFEPKVKAIVHKSQVIIWKLINRELTPVKKNIFESQISAVALHPSLDCLA